MAKRGRRRTRKTTRTPRRPFSPRIEVVRSFVGPRLFGAYRKGFGIARTTSVGEILRRNIPEKKLAALAKKKPKRDDRFLAIKKAKPRRSVSFHPTKRKGYLREYVNGKPTKKLLSISSAKGFKRKESRQRRLDALSVGLALTSKQTRNLVAAVVDKAQKDLRKFKKTKKFRSLRKKDRRKFNVRRERAKYLDLLMDMVDQADEGYEG